MSDQTPTDLAQRVRSYLGNGGFFNPEMMEHDKVRQLIMDLDAEREQHQRELNAEVDLRVATIANYDHRIAELEEQHQREIAHYRECIDLAERANAIIREEGVEARAIIMSRDIEIVKLRNEVAQQAETIRQLQAQIAALTQERDEARSQASLLSTAKAEIIDDLEARCATLTQALEQARVFLASLGWSRTGGTNLRDQIDAALGRETPDPQKGAPTPMDKQPWTRLYRCGASVVGIDPPAACPVHGDAGCPPKPGVHPMSHLDVERANGPHVWIQWKGTDVCCDIHCACGAHPHWDGDFMYFVKCPSCQRVWEVGTHVQLYEVWPDEERAALAEPSDEM